ncbi:MAG: DUF4012 domain-containing protein [Candidatus Buchananbacteria bacterium]|nr:DUF4012 domain-containing protein [Candidatus Buchananbacteria bacterium]
MFEQTPSIAPTPGFEGGQYHDQIKRRRRRWPWVILIVTILIVAVVAPIGYQTIRIAMAATQAKVHIDQLEVAVRTGNWQQAHDELVATRLETTAIHERLQQLWWLHLITPVRETVTSGDRLLVVANDIMVSYESALKTLSQMDARLRDDELAIGFASAEQRARVLETIVSERAQLETTARELATARQDLDAINTTDLRGPLAHELQQLHALLADVITNTDIALPIFGHLPEMLGHDREKTYLIVFQNNTELRPTGGFIGSYGLLKVRNGELISLDTDDVYNLDKLSEGKLKVPAPAPLQRYLNQPVWYLRDSNWSPDWPTSAKQIEWFWNEERRVARLPEQKLDGVIGLTPEFISNLISATGPLMVDGITFTDTDFTQILEQFVEFDYRDRGIHPTDRKDIIGPLSLLLIERLSTLSPDKLLQAWLAFKKNIDQKQILVYFNDPTLQTAFAAQDWSGVMKPVTDDYLMLVDSNLGALKTDQVINRSLTYAVAENEQQELISTLTVTYQHAGQRVPGIISAYRTYARVYVPAGSWFLNAHTETTGERRELVITKDVEIGDEFDRRVAATLVTVAPGETTKLVMSYRLPPAVVASYQARRYELLVQKQPGTNGHPLQISLDLKQPITAYLSDRLPKATAGRTIEWQSDLLIDRRFRLAF